MEVTPRIDANKCFYILKKGVGLELFVPIFYTSLMHSSYGITINIEKGENNKKHHHATITICVCVCVYVWVTHILPLILSLWPWVTTAVSNWESLVNIHEHQRILMTIRNVVVVFLCLFLLSFHFFLNDSHSLNLFSTPLDLSSWLVNRGI